jgi:hypothetical protein
MYSASKNAKNIKNVERKNERKETTDESKHIGRKNEMRQY